MADEKLMSKLHPLERKVLPILKEQSELYEIAKVTELKDVEVMRAFQWLENKGIITTQAETKTSIALDENGQTYKNEGLPEKKLLLVLTTKPKPASQILKESRLPANELNACIGILKRHKAIELTKDKEINLTITKEGEKLSKQTFPEEAFLKHEFPKLQDELTQQEQALVKELLKRKAFVKITTRSTKVAKLTAKGKELAKEKITLNVINRLTPKLLKSGEWKKQQFRAYDIEASVPKISGGKKHFVNEAVEYIRNIWLEMGFKEMRGDYVQSAFWDLDALFVPQDHPAREMQDTFYLDGKAKLPSIWKKIAAVHENGSDTGSKGWEYAFSEEEAKQVMLRTHTTVLSAIELARLKKESLPAKFFAIGKVFRNEALDWKHLFEFYQVDGIVIDPDANLKHLKGYLTQFYKKMGYTDVRMRPAHFPYTEPSLEVDVFHPVKKQWIELGGAGIFRPEVVKPLLGFDCPVLAWGQGMGRIISEYWKIADIRDLYKNDIKQLKEFKRFIR